MFHPNHGHIGFSRFLLKSLIATRTASSASLYSTPFFLFSFCSVALDSVFRTPSHEFNVQHECPFPIIFQRTEHLLYVPLSFRATVARVYLFFGPPQLKRIPFRPPPRLFGSFFKTIRSRLAVLKLYEFEDSFHTMRILLTP